MQRSSRGLIPVVVLMMDGVDLKDEISEVNYAIR